MTFYKNVYHFQVFKVDKNLNEGNIYIYHPQQNNQMILFITPSTSISQWKSENNFLYKG